MIINFWGFFPTHIRVLNTFHLWQHFKPFGLY